MDRDVFSLLIIVVCVGGVALIARYNYVRQRDAAGDRPYVYWKPWRKLVVGVALTVLVLLILMVEVSRWLDAS